MAEFGVLEVNKEYELTVKEIYEAQGSFTSRVPESRGQLFYCHHFILQDEDKIRYKCQICETSITQHHANAGDDMMIKVKSFTRDIHTIEFIGKNGISTKPVATLPGPGIPMCPVNQKEPLFSNEEKLDRREFLNSGSEKIKSIKAIALQCACTFFTNRLEGDECGTVIDKAKEFEQYLES